MSSSAPVTAPTSTAVPTGKKLAFDKKKIIKWSLFFIGAVGLALLLIIAKKRAEQDEKEKKMSSQQKGSVRSGELRPITRTLTPAPTEGDVHIIAQQEAQRMIALYHRQQEEL